LLFLLRQAERKIGVCRRLAGVIPDRRDQSRVLNEMFELVATRRLPASVFGPVLRSPSICRFLNSSRRIQGVPFLDRASQRGLFRLPNFIRKAHDGCARVLRWVGPNRLRARARVPMNVRYGHESESAESMKAPTGNQ